MFCDYEGHGFVTDYAMSVESAKFYSVYYTPFTALLESHFAPFSMAYKVKTETL